MRRTALPSADRSAQADRYQQRGQKALEKRATFFGKSPARQACVQFDKAVQLEPRRGGAIGEDLARHGQARRALRYKEKHYACLPSVAPERPTIATQIGDAYLQRSHAAHHCYSGHNNRAARRYYNQAVEADWSYYPAHVGRYSTYIDGYHHSCRMHFWKRHAQGDVFLYEKALMEWSTVLMQAPLAVQTEWLREPGELFEMRSTPRTAFLYRDYIVPALGSVLAPAGAKCPEPAEPVQKGTDPYEERTRVALVCARRLIDAEPWVTPYLLPYLLQATDTPGLTARNLPDLLRIYDKIAHAPLPEGPALKEATARLRHRFTADSGAMQLLVAFQRIILDAYSQQPALVQASLCELSKLAGDNVPVAFDALDLMLTTVISHPGTAPIAIAWAARRAAKIADANIADADILVYHVIDSLRLLSTHPTPAVSMAVACALQGPLRKYYDAYRAAEEDARRNGQAAVGGGDKPGEEIPGGGKPVPEVPPGRSPDPDDDLPPLAELPADAAEEAPANTPAPTALRKPNIVFGRPKRVHFAPRPM